VGLTSRSSPGPGISPRFQEPSQCEHEDADGGNRHRVVQTNEDPVHGGASGLVVDPVFDGRRALPCRLWPDDVGRRRFAT